MPIVVDDNFNWGSKTKRNMRRRSKKRSAKPRTKVDKGLSRRITRLENRREIKYNDATTDTSPDTTPTSLSLVQLIDRGDQYNEREGDNIYCKKVRFSYILTKPAVASAGPSPPYQIRMVMLWDKVTGGGGSYQVFTGTAPTAKELSSAIFDNRDGMTTINAPYSEYTRDRFKILYDRVHIIENKSPETAATVFVRKTIPLSGAKVEFTDVTYDVDPIEQIPERNLIFLYFCAGSTTTAINYTSRLYYTDD